MGERKRNNRDPGGWIGNRMEYVFSREEEIIRNKYITSHNK